MRPTVRKGGGLGKRMSGLVTLAAILLTAGCGGGGSHVATSSGGTSTLKVGVLPIADVAPLYLGMSKGFFKQEKLTIKPQILQGGAEVTTGVVSGKLNIGFSATEPLIVARSKGLPVQIVSQGNQAAANPADAWDGVLVRSNGPIKSPRDLAGKTIAVNALSGMAELCIKAVLTRQGVDVSKIKFLEVPFPDQVPALQAGRVDAIAPVEPFVSQARAAGDRFLFSYFAGLRPKLTIGTYFATTPFIKQNGDIVNRFVAAMKRSLSYAHDHPSEARQIVLTYTKIPSKAARTMKLSYWSSGLNTPSIQLIAADTKRFGYAKKAVSLNDLIWNASGG